ncbi:hypothetical protein Lesp02_35500 [Lentzea sp. NBRC 105346]|nr:LodA/GoxA family CTQ-dependent oxidase [Lentzea sp. NBRC 105346]GLZ31362.1 hypothetical protein Lesp02_35500 [Lentzea sp. NBRC 105346]
MAITHVKIHPAIGIARVGNSPEEFFVGPERLWDPPSPSGGFKDAQGRIKRQAARFRVFAYHDDGTTSELSAADADVSWTVHLANRKAVTRNPGPASDLTIDPGPRTVSGPGQQELFDTGKITFPAGTVTVPLGEARTDDDGNLLVLGGFGRSASPGNLPITNFLDNAGWYDDVSDGPVTAHVKVGGQEFDATGAWVVVGPPKYAPQIENVVTLHDTVFQVAVDQGWLTTPDIPSYTKDVHPILEAARTIRAVKEVWGAHAWPAPVYDDALRQRIFDRLRAPLGGGGDMPVLNGVVLTKTQYAVMESWRNDKFVRDWNGAPAPAVQLAPAELDKAALASCVGAAFYPGIEAGGIAARPITDASLYVGPTDPMRLDHARLRPGQLGEFLALPWQSDFYACGYNWWPVPRPNEVLPEGGTSRLRWDRDVNSYLEMVNEWHTLGFVVRRGDEYVEVDRYDSSFVDLLTPHLDFVVAQGPLGTPRRVAVPIDFEVRSNAFDVTLVVRSAPERFSLPTRTVTVPPVGGTDIATARLWVLYESGPAGEVVDGTLTIGQVGSGRTWTVSLRAVTQTRQPTATALVLDRSAHTRLAEIKAAASIFAEVALEDDGIGVVKFNEDAQQVVGVTRDRRRVKDAIAGLTARGGSSIGDGIQAGHEMLCEFDRAALVVVTDNNESSLRSIDDVAPEVTEPLYAIGFGPPQNTSTEALYSVAGNTGGYFTSSSSLPRDLLQVLADVSDASVVLSPSGVLVSGVEQRIPFLLTESDTAVDVILLTDTPDDVDFRLQTPSGFVIEPWRAGAEPAMRWAIAPGVQYYRIALPTEMFTERFDTAGTWYVLAKIGSPRTEPPSGFVRESAPGRRDLVSSAEPSASGRVPYSLLVHGYSNLSLRVSARQTGFTPGSAAVVSARLSESGMPWTASVWAEVRGPGASFTVPMSDPGTGGYEGSIQTASAGVYRVRVRASGRSAKGYPFQREHTLTVPVWHA